MGVIASWPLRHHLPIRLYKYYCGSPVSILTVIMSLNLNYNLNTYLTVTLSSGSPFFSEPAQLAAVHPAIAHVGQVGQLQDVQVYSVPKFEWDDISKDVLQKLNDANGVGRVDVQKVEARSKRGSDEL
ncbi:hypothetical protein DXG01_015284 [Tephrocybe rancida]|nr:hypothetical protein DXG01_015284 [Tephrocybe rancida]